MGIASTTRQQGCGDILRPGGGSRHELASHPHPRLPLAVRMGGACVRGCGGRRGQAGGRHLDLEMGEGLDDQVAKFE